MAEGKIINNTEELARIIDSAVNGDIKFTNIPVPGKDDYINNKSWEKTVSDLLKKIN
jgi:hypothetical protein